ncbi:MAG: hypothetical protein ACRDT2_12175, partial [Natronosporangium sp.]
MARRLTDPRIEAAIQRLAASAPPLTEELRARLAPMLQLGRHNGGSATRDADNRRGECGSKSPNPI